MYMSLSLSLSLSIYIYIYIYLFCLRASKPLCASKRPRASMQAPVSF